MKQFLLVLVIPLVIVLVVAAVTTLAISQRIGDAIGMGGTALVLLFAVIYALYDSRKRWPGLPWIERLGKIFSYSR
jgi:hypothetical protein